MKHILALFLTAASVTAAHASDKPNAGPLYKAPGIEAPGWTGLYVNAGIGYGLWTADTTSHDPATGNCYACVTQTQSGQGWLGTVGLGFDYQFAPAFLAGVFGDFSLGSLKGVVQQGEAGGAETTMTSAWAIGGRLGWLTTPDVLAYVNGGYAGARFSAGDFRDMRTNEPTGYWTPAATMHGWFIGGGMEMAIAPGWFWRNEYRYASYDAKMRPLVDTPFDISFKPVVQTVTTQIVFKPGAESTSSQGAAVAVRPTWSGFYVNGGAGYGGWSADMTILDEQTRECEYCVVQRQGGRGWLGRVGVGFDHQIMPKAVVGAFADYDISGLKGTIHNESYFETGVTKQTSAWAVGGRAGWLVTPQILGYGNAGYGQARFSGAAMFYAGGTNTGLTTPDTTLKGWFVGGGIETALTSNLFWRNEYRFAQYGGVDLPQGDANNVYSIITFKPTVQTFTTQLVFKLDAPR